MINMILFLILCLLLKGTLKKREALKKKLLNGTLKKKEALNSVENV